MSEARSSRAGLTLEERALVVRVIDRYREGAKRALESYKSIKSKENRRMFRAAEVYYAAAVKFCNKIIADLTPRKKEDARATAAGE